MTPSHIALAISVAANAALCWAWLDARDAATAAIGDHDRARADASASSDATQDHRDLADQRKREADTGRAAARRAAATHEQRAVAILARPACVAGDDCRSAAQRSGDWLASRSAP